MNSIRKPLSHANIVATLALVFAMGGSAIAANRYLSNSTRRINAKVLKSLVKTNTALFNKLSKTAVAAKANVANTAGA